MLGVTLTKMHMTWEVKITVVLKMHDNSLGSRVSVTMSTITLAELIILLASRQSTKLVSA